MGHSVKRGDSKKLVWRANANLADAETVQLRARRRRIDDKPFIDAAVTVDNTSEDESIVSYRVTAEHTDMVALWDVQITARWKDGTVITFPSDGYELVHVVETLE